MFTLRKKEEEVSYGALIDVSSGSIGFSIIESKRSAPLPLVLYSDRIPFRAYAGEQGDTRKVQEAILSTALTIAGEGLQALRAFAPGKMVDQVFLTCSSPWAYTIAEGVTYEAPEAFRVTKKVIDDLVHKAEEEMLAKVRNLAHTEGADFDVVERATVDISVNGYPVRNPFSVKGKVLALSHVAGLLPQSILRTVEEMQEKILPGAGLKVHTYMLVIYCVLRDVLPKVHSSCIINVTDDATEFGIVENDLLIANSCIRKGSGALAREARKPLADLRSQLLDAVPDAPLSLDDFQPFATTYTAEVIAHLNEVLQHRTLPEDIIILTHKPYGPLFKEMIRKAVKEVTGVVHTITYVNEELLHIETDPHVHEYDAYLAGSARFFHKLHGCAELHVED